MIKLSSGGGVFAEKHPDLLLLSDEDEKETGSLVFFACVFHQQKASCIDRTQAIQV
jgi:hypothetical protein